MQRAAHTRHKQFIMVHTMARIEATYLQHIMKILGTRGTRELQDTAKADEALPLMGQKSGDTNESTETS